MEWNWNRVSTLGIIEELAKGKGLIASEEELSELFDELVKEFNIDLNDKIALNMIFNNWVDSLVRDGEIHCEQAKTYGYVGKYS